MTVATEPYTLPEALASLGFVHTDEARRTSVAHDRSGLPADHRPAAVATPRTVTDVQSLLAAAHQTRTAVVPRGAGTGLTGGAVPALSAIVLDLSGLNEIVSIDPVNQLAVVQPGVITADLDRAAAEHGLRYAPDPASAEISTIGGNIATNAGGFRCVKYGVTRDAVRALDVVLADGRLLHTGAETRKSVTGYDLTSLFVGSEGTLGVIVGATLELVRQPVQTATLRATFTDASAAAEAIVAIRTAGIRPAVAEFLDAATLRVIDDHLGTGYSQSGGALLIIQTDGFAAAVEIEAVRTALEPTALTVDVATMDEDSEALLTARRAALPAIEQRGRVLIEDISVPISQLAPTTDAIARISAETGIEVYVFAHAGDGNLHPIIVVPFDSDDERTAAQVQRTADAIFQLALDAGGTLTGEHGIGQLKLDWVSRELDPVALSVQRSIKECLDPRGVLNPNKALPMGDHSDQRLFPHRTGQ